MNNNWFESRNLKVLSYQNTAITNVQESLEQREVTVLAACPSAGKTLMTIYIIEEYLKQNPNHKVMVLAHGTTILRTQFHDVLVENKPDFTFNLVEKFTQYDVTADVNVCLPQTLSGNILSKIDLLVVDEAHQFYFAEKMMKDIIKQTKPKKQLLLTGTPSPFIRKGFNIVPIALNTIFDEGMISDLYVEIATSAYSFDTMLDYNNDNELKTSVHFKVSETKKTLDDLITKIVERLKSIKDNPYQNLLPEWLPTLKRLQKTMIACKSQPQAMQVKNYFDKIGVKSALSISDIDYNSSEIERFKNENDCLILIVVGRGILGFNYPELVNVVDMTTSQNVDRIYQLLCRVIRKHPEGQKKLFFKVAPNIHSDYYKYIMTAVLSLADENFFTKFNGKNFSDMLIPVIKNKVKREINTNTNTGSKKSKGKIKPIDFEGLPVLQFFKDIYHKKDALLHTYAYTTIRDVRAEFMKVKPNGYWTKENCMQDALIYNTVKDWRSNSASAYSCACSHGWINECTQHMEKLMKPTGYWTKENCILDALNYSTSMEWRLNNGTAYGKACDKGWLEECTAHMITSRKSGGYWTKENCLEEAKKYNTKVEWIKGDGSSYNTAYQSGWFEECCAHMNMKYKPVGYWTKEKCIESTKGFITLKEWRNENKGAFQAATKKGWYDDCAALLNRSTVPNGYWTKEKCIEESQKYTRVCDWQEHGKGSIGAAQKNGWYDELSVNMERLTIQNKPKYWTKEKCLESAMKYDNITDWRKAEGNGAVRAAQKKGWFKECTQHMGGFKLNWTIDICKNAALNYNSPKEWHDNDFKSYKAAYRRKWNAECTMHMEKRNKSII